MYVFSEIQVVAMAAGETWLHSIHWCVQVEANNKVIHTIVLYKKFCNSGVIILPLFFL